MSNKFSYDGYTVTVEFSSDFAFSMTVSDNVTGQFYVNEKVQLTQIKKDTVIATLSRKNEQALKCEFAMVDVEPRKLVVSFIVNFDFLPTFTEYVTLDKVENKKGIHKIESAQIKGDIRELERALNSVGGEGIFVKQSACYGQSSEVLSHKCTRGDYMLEVTGHLNGQGSSGRQALSATISYGKQKWEIPFFAWPNHSYGYPFQFRKYLSLPHDDTMTVTLRSKQGAACNASNVLVSMAPTFSARE